MGWLYGIPPERQIEQRIQTDIAPRWYLGLDLMGRGIGPQHDLAAAAGLAGGRLAATGSTHVKASASRASEELAEMPEGPGKYWERLDGYEEAGLEALRRGTGKRRKKRTRQIRKDSAAATSVSAGPIRRRGI